MDKQYTIEQLEQTLSHVLNISCTYLEKCRQDLASIGVASESDVNDDNKESVATIHSWCCLLLDIIHRSYPLAYKIFPENKDNLDNIFKMFQAFEGAGLLKVCSCDFCKENKPVATEVPTSNNDVSENIKS